MTKSVDVIVLTTTRNARLLATHTIMLKSFLATRPERCRLIVLENNAKGPYQDAFRSSVLQAGMVYRYIDEPFNMNRFYNIGSTIATADFVCYANSDIVFYPSWCENLISWFDVLPELVCACPCTMCKSPWQADSDSGKSSLHLYRRGQKLQKRFVPSYDLAGWFYCFKRQFTLKHPWDERFKAHYQDNDMFNFLRHNHYLAGVAQDSRVDHTVSGSYQSLSTDEKQAFTDGKATYDKKWRTK